MITIGKLAGLTSVSNDTLRYYEQEGLISPAGKSPAGYRLYDRDSARRIHFIKHAQQCGFTLAEIRDLLELRSRDRESKLVKKIDEALERIDSGEYGFCEVCGVEIGVERLEARPTAELCIDCKTLDEIREKQMA